MVSSGGLHIPNDRLTFLPTGSTDMSGSLYLVPQKDLPDRKDRMRAVSILLSTGRVQLYDFNCDLESPCSGEGDWEPFM